MESHFTLSNNYKIPIIGTGPGYPPYPARWKWADNMPIPFFGKVVNGIKSRIQFYFIKKKWINTLSESLKMGYRLIDYSAAYGDQTILKRAIEKSGVKREELFIISRVSNLDQYKNKVRESCMNTLREIGISYIDLYMFHWPVTGHYINTYKEIEKMYKEGLVRSIGVCNCHRHHLEEIMKRCEIIPMVNEFEVHPLFTQKPLIDFCKSHNIHVIAYTPLARNDDRLRSNLILKGISKKYNKTIQQVILRWDIQNGLTPIPRSSNISRNAVNFDIFNFELIDDEMKAIDSININSRLRYDSDNLDFHSIG